MQKMFDNIQKNAILWQFLPVVLIMALLPLLLSDYYVYLLALIIIHALFATSLNLVLGFGGMLHLHPGAFLGLGAYATALIITKTELPFWLGMMLAPFIAALFASVIGWVCVRLRGLYFGMMTLAMGQLLWSLVYRWYDFTGGDNGIYGISLPPWLEMTNGAYFASLLVGTVCFFMLFRIVNSPFGLGLQASRDNPQRTESVGINISRHRLIAFIISGFFAGVAGVLFVVVERSVSPNLLYWSFSAEVLIMCILGGMYKFWGPAIGALSVILLRSYIGSLADYWLLILGAILLVIVLFLPQGILGFISEKAAAWSPVRKAGEKHAQG